MRVVLVSFPVDGGETEKSRSLVYYGSSLFSLSLVKGGKGVSSGIFWEGLQIGIFSPCGRASRLPCL